MKNIIKSLSVIVAVAAIASLATLAIYRDTAISPGNVLGASAVGVDIDLAGDGSTISAYFNLPNMVPGDKVSKCFVIKNPNASIDALFRVYLNQTANDYSPLREKITVQAFLTPSTGCETVQSNLTSQGYTFYSPGGSNQQIFSTPVKLKDLIGPGNAIDTFSDDAIKHPILKGQAAVYKLDVEFDLSADNNFKGKSWTGDIVVDAVQSQGVTSRSQLGWVNPH